MGAPPRVKGRRRIFFYSAPPVPPAAPDAPADAPEDHRKLMEEKVFLVFSTCPGEAEGRHIARTLVEERLAACVNLQTGLRSVYRWDGALQEDAECLLTVKTVEARLPALTERIRGLHAAELPEIVAVPVTAGLSGYLRWVADECRDLAPAG